MGTERRVVRVGPCFTVVSDERVGARGFEERAPRTAVDHARSLRSSMFSSRPGSAGRDGRRREVTWSRQLVGNRRPATAARPEGSTMRPKASTSMLAHVVGASETSTRPDVYPFARGGQICSVSAKCSSQWLRWCAVDREERGGRPCCSYRSPRAPSLPSLLRRRTGLTVGAVEPLRSCPQAVRQHGAEAGRLATGDHEPRIRGRVQGERLGRSRRCTGNVSIDKPDDFFFEWLPLG